MKLNMDKYFEKLKDLWRKMSQVSQYRAILADQLERPYLWGKENPEGSDCSGSVCMALIGAGWTIHSGRAIEKHFHRVIRGD